MLTNSSVFRCKIVRIYGIKSINCFSDFLCFNAVFTSVFTINMSTSKYTHEIIELFWYASVRFSNCPWSARRIIIFFSRRRSASLKDTLWSVHFKDSLKGEGQKAGVWAALRLPSYQFKKMLFNYSCKTGHNKISRSISMNWNTKTGFHFDHREGALI